MRARLALGKPSESCLGVNSNGYNNAVVKSEDRALDKKEPPTTSKLGQSRAEDRLDSWKEIAAYLKRDVRTVQRWEKSARMPVHRLQIDKQGSIYAYKSELDTWYSERRPHLETDSEHKEAGAATGVVRMWRSIAGALLATVMLGSFGTYFIRKSSWFQKELAPRKIKLAVLPFVNLSGDPNQEYFSDGMTEEMITQLGKLDPERLGVIARTSAMMYKSAKKSTPQICHELGVDYILEGSVRRSDNRARVTAQLIQCSDHTHLWADSSERDIVNILALQADVAGEIAQRINLQLTPQQQRSSKSVKSVIPEAYFSYLQGRFYSSQLTKDGLEKGIGYFEQAMHADSNYAPADAALADTYLLLGVFEYWPAQMAFPKAKAAASKALEIDPNSALAHSALGAVYDFYDWNWLAAAREYERAVQLDPGDAWARLHTSNHLLITGRTAESFSQLSRAIELDPLSFLANEQRALALFFTRDYDLSIQVSRKLLELEPNFVLAHEVLARAYEAKGLHEEAFEEWLKTFVLTGEREYADRLSRARASLGLSGAQQLMARTNLQRLQGKSQRDRVPAIRFVWAYLDLHDYDSAVDWLYRAYGDRSSTLLYLKLDPGFDPLRSYPRFQELVRRIGLPP
jgi:TolB-like protein/Tfp pilus assembly protein PilF